MTTLREVKINVVVDDNPDLSYLGEYGKAYKPGAIDREEQGDYEPGQFQYFYPSSNHYPHNPKNWEHVTKADRGKVIKKYGSLRAADEAYTLQDYRRMETFGDSWHCVGIYAVATVLMGDTLQEIRSGGLWGIESDSGLSDLREVAQDELNELRETLRHELAITPPDSEWQEVCREAIEVL